MVVYDRQKRRLYVFHARVHHGMVGLFLFGLGLWLMLDDKADIPWLRDNL